MANKTTENYFADEDSYHGYAKRVILYRYLQKKFASYLQTNEKPSGKYAFTYFDSFAGEGRYGTKDLGGVPVDRSYGSPLIALHALYTIRKKVKQSKNCLFIFEEADKKRFKILRSNIKKYLKTYDDSDSDGDTDGTNSDDYTVYTKIKIKIIFSCTTFKDFDFASIQNHQPMISFVDPFGYSHTPMKEMQSLLGSRREILFNFMVQSLNRFLSVDKQTSNINKLMGDSKWIDDVPKNYKSLKVPEKMYELLKIYISKLEQFHRNQSLKTTRFSMRKGSASGTDKGFIYFLIFASEELKSIAQMKYAMNVAEEDDAEEGNEEMFFTDYNFDPENPKWYPITDIKEEARYILNNVPNHLHKCSFGELKEWILLYTPYQVHSKALRELEKEKYMEVTVPDDDIRSKKELPPYVGVNNNDIDIPGKKEHRYKNNWVIRFPNLLAARLAKINLS